MTEPSQNRTQSLTIEITTPSGTCLSADASKLKGGSLSGAFTLLPNHIDVVIALVPSVMTLGAEDEEQFVALDHGTLVKEADTVRISVRRAVVGESLETLAKTVKETFKKIEEREKTARAAGMKLEASFAREMTKSNR